MNETEIQKLNELLNDAILKYNKIDYELIYAYHHSSLKIKMGELEDEECGDIYSLLNDWFWIVQNGSPNTWNPFYSTKGQICKDGDEFFLNLIYIGPFDGEFDDFDTRFTFDRDWFLNKLGMKNDEFIINNPDFDIKNVHIYCQLENYRLGDLEHKFDFELKYCEEEEEEEVIDFVLNENQKEIVQYYILKTIFSDYLPSLIEAGNLEQFYSYIEICGDVDSNFISVGEITTSNEIISMNEIYNYYKKHLND
jgi:hypothetical protein